MINDITKTIFFKFTNSFTKQMIAVIEMPYLPFKATNGYYSTMYKRFKKVVPFKTDSSLVVGKKWTEPQITKRTLITLNGGISLDLPHDLNEKDIKIMNHHLEGLKMSIT